MIDDGFARLLFSNATRFEFPIFFFPSRDWFCRSFIFDFLKILGRNAKYMSDQKKLHRLAECRSVVVKAMAHPTRLLVMDLLTHGEKCVNEITRTVGCDVTTLSKHLAIMKNAGLLESEKRGVQVFYRIACPCFMEFFRCIDLIQRNQTLQDHCVSC